jgi:two-component system response regulator MprA
VEVLSFEGLRMNLATREVSRDGEPISLTVREFALLQTLLSKPNRVLPRADLFAAVWGEDFVGDANLLDVYIRYLRKKIERPGLPTLIHTVRGVGFMLKVEP